MRWPDFPDVTSDFEPDIPDETDACQSELKVAGAFPELIWANQSSPAEGLKNHGHQ
jgi:hypothetical protein